MAYVLPVWTASDDTTAPGIDWWPRAAQSVSPMAPPVVIHDTTIVTGDTPGRSSTTPRSPSRGRRIVAARPQAEILARYPSAERVDGRGRAVLPGLRQRPHPPAAVLARGIYEDLSPPHTPPFTGGLAPLPLPALSGRRGARDGAARRAGGDPLAGPRSCSRTAPGSTATRWRWPTPVCGCSSASARGTARAPRSVSRAPFEVDAAHAETGLARIADLHARWHGAGDGRVRVGLAAWAPDLCSPELLGRLRGLQDELGVARDRSI